MLTKWHGATGFGVSVSVCQLPPLSTRKCKINILPTEGEHGFGFRPGSSMSLFSDVSNYVYYFTMSSLCPQNGRSSPRYDPPHLIMTYTALLSLSILRDDFS